MFMRFKFKPAWIGLFLIGVMLFSTFAYAFLQSFNKPDQKLPTSNVIAYSLESSLKSALIQYGATIVTFDYNLGCENCVNQKAVLEFYAKEYEKQIFLEELLDNNLDKSKITVESAYGIEELINANEIQIVGTFCKLLVEPPATCALITS